MNEISFNFSGENVVVSGGTKGIGAAVAITFAKAGAAVIVLGTSQNIEQISEDLSNQAGRTIGYRRCDVADPEQVTEMANSLEKVDVFVNNAGIEKFTPSSPASDTFVQDIQRTACVNFTGALMTTKAIVSHMIDGGRIIFTASIWSKIGVADFSAYCASKHATLGMVRSFAREFGPHGIRVNAVCPGWVRTSASFASLKSLAKHLAKSEDSLLHEITSEQCIGGLLEPAEVAETYLFLASRAASDITGQSITIDRGETCI